MLISIEYCVILKELIKKKAGKATVPVSISLLFTKLIILNT